MRFRVAAGAFALVLVVAVATGCQPEPTPSPTTPVFANEAEAFAAAEETYRAYVDALNQVDLANPDTFEAVYAWTTGDANAEARRTFSQMHADQWRVSGKSRPDVVQPRAGGGADFTEVELAVCLDVSDVKLVDSGGQSVVSPDRPTVQSMLVSMTFDSSTQTRWTIDDFDGREGEPTCG